VLRPKYVDHDLLQDAVWLISINAGKINAAVLPVPVLSGCHEIMTFHNDRYGFGLNWGGGCITYAT